MLSRLLLVVLTVGAPMPYRVCTCDAGHADHDPTPVAASDGDAVDHHTPAHEHHPDCLSKKLPPPVNVTDPTDGPDAPDAAVAFVTLTDVLAPVSPGVASPPDHPPRGPTRPLFITLLTLRN